MTLLLANVPIFCGVDDEAQRRLLRSSDERTAQADQVILHEGEMGNRLFIIVSGSVRVCKRFGQPGEVLLATLGPTDFFGEMCILEAQPRSATVVATTETVLLSIPASAFYQLFHEVPAQYGILVLNIARDLSRRLRRLDDSFAARH